MEVRIQNDNLSNCSSTPGIIRKRRKRQTHANVPNIKLQKQGSHMLSTYLARDLSERYLFQNLLGSNQDFFVQVQPLLCPILPSVFVTKKNDLDEKMYTPTENYSL